MRIFLDECVDWRLARDIVGHDVKTARQMGWATVKNGELLKLAAEHFDVFVTVIGIFPFSRISFPSPLLSSYFRQKRTGFSISGRWCLSFW